MYRKYLFIILCFKKYSSFDTIPLTVGKLNILYIYLGVLGKTEGADPTADVFEQYDEYIESQVRREYLFHRRSWIKNKE
jgi:hypothetical protein